MWKSPWGGEATTLLRKTTLVSKTPDHLPVHTLTFATPKSYGEFTGCKIGNGDVIKVCVPDYKPKSYSMSAERPGEFDITFKVYPNGRASGFLDRIEAPSSLKSLLLSSHHTEPGTQNERWVNRSQPSHWGENIA